MNKRVLSILLSLMMLASCLPLAVSAEVISDSKTLTVGEEVQWTLMEASVSVESVTVSSGALPKGLETKQVNETACIVGTVTEAGSFACTVTVKYNSESTQEFYLAITVAAQPAVKITKHPIGEFGLHLKGFYIP